MLTELLNGDEHICANLERMFGDVGDQFLTENLSLDENGDSVQDINLGSVIKRKVALLIFDQNIFEGLEQNLIFSDYELNKSIFYLPYDWRLDLDEAKDLLKQKIEEIKLQTGSSKVDIISHSMGGLLTKAYIKEYGKDSIDKLIFVGTPHIGAPKSGKVILKGDNFSIPWLRQARIEELALNMPSLHQLLPNQTYFNQFQGYIKPFDFLGNEPLYDYNQTKNFFVNDKNKNQIMFNRAEDFLPPLSTVILSGISGQTGFYRSDVNILLNSTDNLSGVLSLNYNIDGMGYKKISGDIAEVLISTEGEHTISFFSTDRAGNNETEKTITFTIDKTAPEAVIEFDINVKDIIFNGLDTTQVKVTDNDDTVNLTDQAGNITEINLKDKNRKKKMSAEVKSIKYNQEMPDISKNKMVYKWDYNKSGELIKFSQHIKSKKDYNISADFDGKNTVVKGKDSFGKISKLFTGLKILKITTNKGDFDWSY